VENIRRIVQACADFGIHILTIYAFSTENWQRPEDEVRGLLRLMEEVIDRETMDLHAKGVRVTHLGRLDGVPPSLQEKVRQAVALTQGNTKFTLNVAFNYGGRAEIVDAVRRMLAAGLQASDVTLAAGLQASDVTEEVFGRYLYTEGQPDPDLVIRTAGEMRLSNFLIWQAAYAEYYATPAYWPDFDQDELWKALVAYSQRERRFGRVLCQDDKKE